ncbi:hypothetical protein OAJ22_00455 [Acidimicrobiaceae bacterium]|jgi:hypothetical protein|nr:hypothetical protein [Acidimicrobiaceae bacterium]|tara:strand:+ start:1183 stop:2313 length:1131 start_codon:yes stop_codon:yes gene_type:complete
MAIEKLNPGDISLKNREILFKYWEEIYSQDNSPSDFLNYLSSKNFAVYEDFNEKVENQCRNILKKGYKQWAYKNYRYDHNGEEGVLTLFAAVNQYLLESSTNEKFLNMKEVFKNGVPHINRHINSTIKRVLAATRETTVIDRLLRRIEEIADDDSNDIVRTRTEEYGNKADYFTLVNKFPEERPPTNDEIEAAIALVGGFKEHPPAVNAKQASKVYSTKQLIEIMEIICNTLPTDVTPNTLETIFIDLIPDFLPDEFLIEKAFKIYGHVNFPVDVNKKLTLTDLEQVEQIIVLETVNKCLKEVNNLGITEECKIIKNYVEEKDLKINKLVAEPIFSSREHVEEVLESIGRLTNNLFSTFENEESSELAFTLFFDKL